MSETPSLLDTVREQAAAARVPLHVQMELTHRCNLTCSHCYLRGTDWNREELSLDEIRRVLVQLREAQSLFLSLTGGEPTLRQDLSDILGAARDLDFVTSLLTNGTLIDAGLARRVSDARVHQVHISVLGLEPEHDRIAGHKGAFQEAILGMDRLRAHGVNVVAKLVLTRDSIRDLEPLQELVARHADTSVVSVDLVPTLQNDPPPADLQPAPADLRSLPVSEREEDFAPAAPQDHHHLCSAARSLVAISPSGEVFPCMMLRESMGNLKEQPFDEIWDCPGMRELADLKREDLHDCRGCDLVRYCPTCPGRGWSVFQDPTRATEDQCERAERFRVLSEHLDRPLSDKVDQA